MHHTVTIMDVVTVVTVVVIVMTANAPVCHPLHPRTKK